MLTLAGSLRAGAFTAYRDVVWDGGRRTLTPRFYLLPDAPRLARDEDGGPAFRFLRHRSLSAAPGAATPLNAGGLLLLTVELAPSSDEAIALRRDLAAQAGLDAAAVELLAPPFREGAVTLALGGDAGGGDLTRQVAGAGPASLVGASRQSFAVDLTADGAALLEAALERDLALVFADYDLRFEYRLDGIVLRVWCDATLTRTVAAAEGARAGAPVDPSALVPALFSARAAGVELTSDAPIPPEQQATLQALGAQLLQASLRAASPPPAPDGPAAAPVPSLERLQASFNHTYTASQAAEQRVVVAAPIALTVTADQRPGRVVLIDLDTAQEVLVISAHCPVDFAGGLLGSVHLWIDYGARAADGVDVARAADVVFREGTTAHVFRFDAVPGARRYRRRATVTYKDGSTAELGPEDDDATVLVLGVDRLGVLDVEVSLGDVPLDAVRAVVADLAYPPRELSTELVLDGTTPSGRWQVVAGAAPLAPCRVRAAWLTTDGRRVQGEARDVSGPRIYLDAPPGLAARAEVTVIAAGNFEGVAQILVELRTGPQPEAETTALTFTAAGQSRTWAPHVAVAGAPLHYQARRTLTYADGVVRTLEWTDEDAPLLVAQDFLRFTVHVVPRLLDLGGAFSLAVLALEHTDEAAGLRDGQTLVLHGRDEAPSWTFRLGAADRRGYRHQLTLVARDGGRSTGPWVDGADEVLVLHPLDEES